MSQTNQAVVCATIIPLIIIFLCKRSAYTLKGLLWEGPKYKFAITHIILMTLLYRQAASHHRLLSERVSQIVWQTSSRFAKIKMTCGYMAWCRKICWYKWVPWKIWFLIVHCHWATSESWYTRSSGSVPITYTSCLPTTCVKSAAFSYDSLSFELAKSF